MSRHPTQHGFTLFELILVMAVICISLAMIAPSLRGFWANSQVKEAGNQIVALTRLARTKAIADATSYRLNLDTNGGTFWLTMRQQQEWVELGSESGRHFELPRGVSIELQREIPSDENCIDFRPNGQCDVATIRLSGSGGDQSQITCRSPTELFAVVQPTEGTNR